MSFTTELKQLRLADKTERYPASMKTGYFDAVIEVKLPKSAAQMEALLIEFIKLSGFHAQKITTTGVYRDDKKSFKDVVGRTRVIGTGTWTPGTSTKGAADIRATIHGLDFQFEIKFSKSDKQKDNQKEFEEDVKRGGGQYFIVRTLDQFLELYYQIMGSDRVKMMEKFNNI